MHRHIGLPVKMHIFVYKSNLCITLSLWGCVLYLASHFWPSSVFSCKYLLWNVHYFIWTLFCQQYTLCNHCFCFCPEPLPISHLATKNYEWITWMISNFGSVWTKNQESSLFYSRGKMKLEVYALKLYFYIFNGFPSGRVYICVHPDGCIWADICTLHLFTCQDNESKLMSW